MKKILFLILPLLLSACSLGVYQLQFNDESVEDRFKNFNFLPTDEQPSIADDEYTFLLFADLHIGNKTAGDYREKLLSWIDDYKSKTDKKLHPRFAVSIGDNMHTGREWKEYNSLMTAVKERVEGDSPFGFRTYNILGNHDLYHNGWDVYKEHIYPYKSTYRFSDGTFNFYAIDSANGTLGNNQREALEKELEKDSKPKIILSHVPFFVGGTPTITFVMQNTMERNKMLTMLQKNNVKQAFVGHEHNTFECDYGFWREDAIAAYCSGWFALITVNKSTLEIKRKLVDLN